MRALIFTEGGSQIGLGHISRCSSLYDELVDKGIKVEFVINSDTIEFEIIRSKNYKIVNWLSKEFLTYYIKQDDYCIVDSYLASKELLKTISDRAQRTLFIDDNARIEYPEGIVVNPSLSTKTVKYPNNHINCYLIGPKYVILRSPFIQVRRTHINSQVQEVLITLGGSDIHNLTPSILKQLINKNPEIILNVIIGNAFENIEELKSFRYKNINLYDNVTAEEMKSIMLKSDFAITAAGQTIYELISTQTPFIPIKVIENQNNNVTGLKEHNLVKEIMDYKDKYLLQKIEDEFNKLLNIDKRTQIINQYNDIIDGLGSRRLMDKLLDDKR